MKSKRCYCKYWQTRNNSSNVAAILNPVSELTPQSKRDAHFLCSNTCYCKEKRIPPQLFSKPLDGASLNKNATSKRKSGKILERIPFYRNERDELRPHRQHQQKLDYPLDQLSTTAELFSNKENNTDSSEGVMESQDFSKKSPEDSDVYSAYQGYLKSIIRNDDLEEASSNSSDVEKNGVFEEKFSKLKISNEIFSANRSKSKSTSGMINNKEKRFSFDKILQEFNNDNIAHTVSRYDPNLTNEYSVESDDGENEQSFKKTSQFQTDVSAVDTQNKHQMIAPTSEKLIFQRDDTNQNIEERDLKQLSDFRNDHYFETHSTEDLIKSVPQHICVHSFGLDNRLLPQPLHSDVYHTSRCIICGKPMENQPVNKVDERFEKKKNILPKFYKYGLAPRKIYMANDDNVRIDMKILCEDENFKASVQRRPNYFDTYALRYQRGVA